MNGQLDQGCQSDAGFSDQINGSLICSSTCASAVLDQGEEWNCQSSANQFCSQTAGAVRSACSLLREHFPWFEEEHLRERPTLQGLTDLIIQREAAYNHNVRSCLSGRGVCDALSILEVVSSSRRDVDKLICLSSALQRGVDQAIAAVIAPIVSGGTDVASAGRIHAQPRAPPDWIRVASQLKSLLSAAAEGSANSEIKSMGKSETAAAAAAAALSYGGSACRELDTLAKMVLSDLGPEYLSLLRDHGGADGFAGVDANCLSILTLHTPIHRNCNSGLDESSSDQHDKDIKNGIVGASDKKLCEDGSVRRDAKFDVCEKSKTCGDDKGLSSVQHDASGGKGLSSVQHDASGGCREQSREDEGSSTAECRKPFDSVDVDEHCSGLLSIFMSPPFSGHNVNEGVPGHEYTGHGHYPVIEVPARYSSLRTSQGQSSSATSSGVSVGTFRRAPAGSLVIVAGRMLEAVTSPPPGSSAIAAGAARRFPLRPRLRIVCSRNGRHCSPCNSGGGRCEQGIVQGAEHRLPESLSAVCGENNEVDGEVQQHSEDSENRSYAEKRESTWRDWVYGAEGLFVYELHAHPGAVLTPEEYGRMCMGKATPPLFRSSLSVRSVLSTSVGRPSLQRLLRPDLFPGLLATPFKTSRYEDASCVHGATTVTQERPVSGDGADDECVLSDSRAALDESTSATFSADGAAQGLGVSRLQDRAEAGGELTIQNQLAVDAPNAGCEDLCVATLGASGVNNGPSSGRVALSTKVARVDGSAAVGHGTAVLSGATLVQVGVSNCACSCLSIPDVACLLLGYLDLTGLCRAGMVCKAWRMAGASASLWRRVDLSSVAHLVTDEALAMLACRLRHTRRLILNGCGRVTDVGVEIILGSDPARRGGGREERDRWARECEAHGLPQEAYGMEVVIKNHRFRVYGFGRDSESGRSFVRGRTTEGGEVKVRADHVLVALGQTNKAACAVANSRPDAAVHAPRSPSDLAVAVGGAAESGGGTTSGVGMWLGSGAAALTGGDRVAAARFEHVSMQKCRLMTIRSVRLLEAAAADLQGVPGPVTICVEAEGSIAARTVIFFKIRRNQPLKRLLTSYTATAQLVHPAVRVEFRFRSADGAAVYAHDTALGLGLDEADDDGVDVPRFIAVLPRLRVRIYLLSPSFPSFLQYPRQLCQPLQLPPWLGISAESEELGQGRSSSPEAGISSGRSEPPPGAAAAAVKARWYGAGAGVEEFEFVLRGSERLDALDAQCRARIGLPLSLLCLQPSPPPPPTAAQASGMGGSPWGSNMGFVTPPLLSVTGGGQNWRMNMQATPAQLGWTDGQRLWGQRAVTVAADGQRRPAGGRVWRQVPASSAWFIPKEWGVSDDSWLLVADEGLAEPCRLAEAAGLGVSGGPGLEKQVVIVVFGLFPGVGSGSGCAGSARLAALASCAVSGAAALGSAAQGPALAGAGAHGSAAQADAAQGVAARRAVGGVAGGKGSVKTLLVDLRHVLTAAARCLRVTPTVHVFTVSSSALDPYPAAMQAGPCTRPSDGGGPSDDGGGGCGGEAMRDCGWTGAGAEQRLVAVVEGADEGALRDAVRRARMQ